MERRRNSLGQYARINQTLKEEEAKNGLTRPLYVILIILLLHGYIFF
jgi:hypothetical protein